jgi:drug/metabolite transporter (DMT)-like permease
VRAAWPLRFVLLAIAWGSTFLFIKVGDEALAPLQVSLGRMLVGSATLLAILAMRREQLPAGTRLWARLAVAGILLNVAPFTLFAYGETRISSVLAGLWNATTPLLVLLVASFMLPDERPTARRAAAPAAGFAGVVLVLGPWRGLGASELLGQLMCLGAATGYGIAFPYTRRFLAGRPESGTALSAGQLL